MMRGGATRVRGGHGQRGSVILVSMVILVLIALGALYTLRGVVQDTALADRFAQRQQSIQASDFALQWITNQVTQLGQTQMLEVSAAGQPWYQPTAGFTSFPGNSYWGRCIAGNSASGKCASVPMPASVGKQAWAFVEPTGRVDPYACSTQGFTAVYYDIWIHLLDPRTNLSTNVESLYKLCVLTGSVA